MEILIIVIVALAAVIFIGLVVLESNESDLFTSIGISVLKILVLFAVGIMFVALYLTLTELLT